MFSTSILGASARRRRREDSLQNRAYRLIKDRIISNQLPPASVIDARALSKELKLGHTPIRQALRQLALENLVVILPRRGTIVADVNASDLQKVYELRLQLVPFAFRLAADRISPGQIAAIEAVLAEMKPVIERGAAADLLLLDLKCQMLVVEAAQNEFLAEILERLHNQALRFWHLERVDQPSLRRQVRQHRAIVAALKAGRGPAAARLIRDIIFNFHRDQTSAAVH